MGFFERLKDGLQKTRKNFTERIEVLVGMSAEIDDDFLDELEMILLSADVGAKTTEKLIEAVRQAARKKEIKGTEDVVPFLKKYLTQMLTEEGQRTRISGTPTVILVVGVNGVGKTTTIGKLANYFHLLNYKVMIAAADTFRAAASEQLEIWGKRAGCDVIKHAEGADPAAVVFHETFLVLDATTGQNAITQAKVFTETANVTGVVLTKLDGTAKGGVVIAIREELGLPVKWIGVGEGIMDFRPFEPEKFVDALFNADK